jgi:hypothetical protein
MFGILIIQTKRLTPSAKRNRMRSAFTTWPATCGSGWRMCITTITKGRRATEAPGLKVQIPLSGYFAAVTGSSIRGTSARQARRVHLLLPGQRLGLPGRQDAHALSAWISPPAFGLINPATPLRSRPLLQLPLLTEHLTQLPHRRRRVYYRVHLEVLRDQPFILPTNLVAILPARSVRDLQRRVEHLPHLSDYLSQFVEGVGLAACLSSVPNPLEPRADAVGVMRRVRTGRSTADSRSRIERRSRNCLTGSTPTLRR